MALLIGGPLGIRDWGEGQGASRNLKIYSRDLDPPLSLGQYIVYIVVACDTLRLRWGECYIVGQGVELEAGAISATPYGPYQINPKQTRWAENAEQEEEI